jgi:hypothetical protein
MNQKVLRNFISAIVSFIISLPTSSQAQDGPFQFALIGDMPYTYVQEKEYQNVLAALNAADLAFVIHVGDTQNDPRGYYPDTNIGSLPCTEENYKAIYDSFQSVRHPFILTPGDNDWADCHLVREPKIDPIERLAKVRAMYFPEKRSLGQRTIPVESQSKEPQFAKFRENLRWTIGGVTFATLHIIGSNDNFGRTPEMDAEQTERKAANIAWMRAAFAAAKAASGRGVVLMAQANPGFENYWPRSSKSRYFSRSSRADSRFRAIGRRSTITSPLLAKNWRTTTSRSPFSTATRIFSGSTNRSTATKPIGCLKTLPVSRPSATRTPIGSG